MFQSQAVCATRTFATSPRRAFRTVEPGVSAMIPHGTVQAPAFTSPVIVQDSSVMALRDKAEAMRAEMSSLPNVAAVTIIGLRQQGLAVEYTPRRLASFGLTPASLAAAVPADQAQSRPGHLALQTSAAADLQSVANLPVRAGDQVFRLGNVAMVTRVPLAAPVSTMTIEGQPAAQLSVVPVR